MLGRHVVHILKHLILLFSCGPEGLACDAEASCLYCFCCVFCIAYFSPLCRDVVDRYSTRCTDTKLVNGQFGDDAVKSGSKEFAYAMDAFQILNENYVGRVVVIMHCCLLLHVNSYRCASKKKTSQCASLIGR